jgi:hypothetical protein
MNKLNEADLAVFRDRDRDREPPSSIPDTGPGQNANVMQVQNGRGCLGCVLRLEVVPGRNKLVGDDVAQLLDVPQAFLQSLNGGCALCAALA